MGNTYTQLYIQIVCTVQGPQSLIKRAWRDELYAYIGGIISNKGSKPLAINGMPDHVHIFIGLNIEASLSNLVREIKTSTNKLIKNQLILISMAKRIWSIFLQQIKH